MRYRRGATWPRWVADEPFFDEVTYERALRVERIRERVAERRRAAGWWRKSGEREDRPGEGDE